MAFLSNKLDWSLANSQWASTLNPIVQNPLNSVTILKNIKLETGTNIINHGLGQTPSGWFPIDPQSSATVYRSAPLNSKTLTLTASAPITLSIGVFQ